MTRKLSIAIIDEADCVGCTKCIQACPVDAIIGSHKLMHAVIDHECIGCGLCVAPCPVDCIEMVESSLPIYDKDLAKQRVKARKMRLANEAQEKEVAYQQKRVLAQQVLERLKAKNVK